MPGSCSSGFRSRPSAGGREQAVERVRGEQQEQQEAEREQAHDGEDARHHLVGQVPAEGGDRERPEREHQQPQQDRAFVAAPDRGDAVVQRQRAVRVGGDVEHREVVADEGQREADERERRPARTAAAPTAAPAPSSRAGSRAAPSIGMTPSTAATPSAIQSAKWPSSGIIGHFRSVRRDRLGQLRVALLGQRAFGGLGRHVVLVVLGEHFAGDEHAVLRAGPARRRPCLP